MLLRKGGPIGPDRVYAGLQISHDVRFARGLRSAHGRVEWQLNAGFKRLKLCI